MNNNKLRIEEIRVKGLPGIPLLIINIAAIIAGIALFVFSVVQLSVGYTEMYPGVIAGALVSALCSFLFAGYKLVRPNEAIVFTLFGKYYGTLVKEGFYFVNPFVSAVTPPPGGAVMRNNPFSELNLSFESVKQKGGAKGDSRQPSNKISMKAMTMNNDRQKINDKLGNPIEIGIVVIWKVVNTARAIFDVDDYVEYLSIQCDSALRSIVRLYPYDTTDEDEASRGSLRGSSQEICAKLQEEIQSKVAVAGLEILEAKITHLAYAPEIAAAMLQRQQANAIVDARNLIVDGAVGMVEMALEKLSERGVVQLDEERKATMVSNLMVVLCGNRDAQPIVNTGSLY